MKKFFVLSAVSIAALYSAQTIGNSPYAGYGIGDIKYDNTVEHSGMGGITTAYISDFNNSFNFQNPAANTNFALSTIRFEATNENNFYTSNVGNYKGKKHSSYLSNIVIAFPLSKKVKFGMGYQPYSTKNYNIRVKDVSNINYHFEGKGTLSTIQGALSYQVTPEIGLGLRSNYYFGVLSDINELVIDNVQYVNGKQTTNKIKNFNFTIGANYQKTDEDDKKITLGATATFGNIGSSEVNYVNSTYLYNKYGTKENESILSQTAYDGKDYFPFQASLGAGYGKNLKWFVGTQVDYKKGYDSNFQGNTVHVNNAMRFAVGGWMLPNVNNFRNYFQRVTYRFGTYYEKSGLSINGKELNEFGLSLGVSLPFKNSSINRMNGVDLAVEFGKRGTVQNQLINQNFINLKIGFNFSDRWFMKNVYN